ELARSPLGGAPECGIALSALERGVAYPAGYLEGDTLQDRRETKDGLLDTLRVLAVQHAHVDLCGDLWRDHVRSQSTVDRAHVHRDSPLAIIECEQPLDLVGDLEDRAGAFIGVEARMARATLDHDSEVPGSLTRGLELPRRSE